MFTVWVEIEKDCGNGGKDSYQQIVLETWDGRSVLEFVEDIKRIAKQYV